MRPTVRPTGLLGELGVTLAERIDAAFGINHRLGSGEVRVALRASVYLHRLLGGTRSDNVTACAGNRRFVVVRMNIALHDSSLPFKIE